MNIQQISQGLLAKFEQCRLVFWQDSNNEFLEMLSGLALHDDAGNKIEIIRLDEQSHFQVKTQIELLEPETFFLLYSNSAPNHAARDWLYDIRLYAQSFCADSSSMILAELGMRMEFRPVVAEHRAFFSCKVRIKRLKKLLPDDANKDELQLGLIAASWKVESANFIAITQYAIVELASALNKAGGSSEVTATQNDLFEELEKYHLEIAFWQFAKNTFGYVTENFDEQGEPEKQLSLVKLQYFVVKLLMTECFQSLQNSGVTDDAILERFNLHLLPIALDENGRPKGGNFGRNSSKRAEVVNIVKSIRESFSMASAYNVIAGAIQSELELKLILDLVQAPQLLRGVETFEYAEQRLIILLTEQINQIEQVALSNLVSHRLTAHWARSEKKYVFILNALKAAKEFYTLKQQYIDGFNYASAKALYRAYEEEIYLFDASYRVFCENAHKVAEDGSDILKKSDLVFDIEKLYVNWYLHDLAVAWGRLIDDERLLEKWKLPGVSNQYDFYKQYVATTFQNTNIKRVFVIVSDALRYEVAHAISEQINNEKRFTSEMKSQLGVVPSYTQLGMAALLPHDELTVQGGSEIKYKADGLSVHGHENRKKILEKRQGLAFKDSEVLNWTNDEGREKVHNAKVIYIYHDQIDAIGDKLVTENQTFAACATAIVEIKKLVERIINRLNASLILVTADHGFLFKSSEVVDADKTALTVTPKGCVEAKKRYLIGSNLPKEDFYWQGKLAATANLKISDFDAEFIVPKGSNRFNFVGGAKFIHGGIMPQEICVPVLKISQLKTDKQQAKHSKERVQVVPLMNPIRIVALIDKIELYQASAVGESYIAREVEFWIEDPDGNAVSHKQKVMFDATTDKQDDRKRRVTITLKATGFKRTISYKLMMNDITQPNRPMLLPSHSVIIDIAFDDDLF